jgi:hypothetical protein
VHDRQPLGGDGRGQAEQQQRGVEPGEERDAARDQERETDAGPTDERTWCGADAVLVSSGGGRGSIILLLLMSGRPHR